MSTESTAGQFAGAALSSYLGGGGGGGGEAPASGLMQMNPYAAGFSALGSAMQGAPSAATSGDVSNRSPIYVAPVGVNLGAIMNPMSSGSPENGGYGVETKNRLGITGVNGMSLGASMSTDTKFPILPIALISGAALLTLILLKRKK